MTKRHYALSTQEGQLELAIISIFIEYYLISPITLSSVIRGTAGNMVYRLFVVVLSCSARIVILKIGGELRIDSVILAT